MTSAPRDRERIPVWRRLSYPTRERLIHGALNVLTAVALFIVVFPLFWVFSSALRPSNEILVTQITLLPQTLTLENFQNVLFDRPVPRYYWNTFIVAFGVTLLNTTVATIGGYGLARVDIPYKRSFARMILLGYMFPPILLAIPIFIFWREIGLVNSFLGLAMAEVAIALPFSLWMMWKFFQSVPESLEESAKMAGATQFRAFYEIALPIAKPGMVAIAIFSYAVSWNAYTLPKILITDSEKFVLTVGVEVFLDNFSVQWAELMAAIGLAILPSFFFVFLLQKYMLEGFKVASFD